jgi:DNA-binding winged helix-turn-helix (wHTH) protein
VLEREDIYQRVWGYTMARGDRSVDVFVRKLRHKLERVSPAWRYVHTHFGVGYRFAAERVDGGADAARPADHAAPAASEHSQRPATSHRPPPAPPTPPAPPARPAPPAEPQQPRTERPRPTVAAAYS